MKQEGLRPDPRGHACWHWILGEPCPDAYCTSPSDIPFGDHFDAWLRGDQHVITFQPYGFGEAERSALEEFCRARGLSWREMPESSWHYPVLTTLVVVETAEDNRCGA